MIAFLQILAGLLMLIAGGEVLVKGSVAVAQKLKISTVIVGLTVVAYGTSAPEALVSFQAAAQGYTDIAVGNVIGSNLANILLVAGLTAIIWPIEIHHGLAKRDGIMLVGMTFLLCLLALLDGKLDALDASLMILLLGVYTLYAIYDAKREEKDKELVAELKEETEDAKHYKFPTAIAMIASGIGLLVYGADTMVTGAVTIAEAFGVPEAVIGATIVAFGTSAPELVTSLVAAFRKHADIGLANIVGSNIFNTAGVTGLTGMFYVLPIPSHIGTVDMWALMAVTLVFFVILLTRKLFGRIEGICFTAGYLAYMFWQYSLTVA